jgi:hypothetical protein
MFQQGSFMFSKKERFFSREKLLQKDRGVLSFRQKSCFCFDEESFSFSKEALCFRKRKDSSVAKSSFRMTKTYCHSDRKAVFALTRNLYVSARNLYTFVRKDSSVAKSSFRMTKTYCHSDRKAVFALTRNLYVSARNLYTFVRKDSSVAKSSFRMTKTYCHFDRESIFSSIRNLYVFDQKGEKSLCRIRFGKGFFHGIISLIPI